MLNTIEKIKALGLAAIIMAMALIPAQAYASVDFSPKDNETFLVGDDNLFSREFHYHHFSPFFAKDIEYCDSCGMAYRFGFPTANDYCEFDDGTDGYACSYCQDFFNLTDEEREVLRDYYAE